jgi:hypothetical protein
MGQKTDMTPFAYHLSDKETKSSRSQYLRRIYPADDSPIEPILEDIACSFVKETVSILKTYKPIYTLHSLYEHEDDHLPFLCAVRLCILSSKFSTNMHRYNDTVRANMDLHDRPEMRLFFS